MQKRIIIDANFPTETRVALLDRNNEIENIEFTSDNKKQIKGNIYLAKVTRIEPALQAAFVDYGDVKGGFLPFSEIHPDYYQTINNKRHQEFIGQQLATAAITKEDNKEKIQEFPNLLESEIDIDTISKMVDQGQEADFNIEAAEDEIDSIEHGGDHHTHRFKDYRIQEVIKKGQVMLVQATKEERGNKGAAFTTYISLAGKYCVLMPNKANQNGVSRRISNHDERRRLKDIIANITSSANNRSFSVILRTAGVGQTTSAIKKDYEYLANLWNKIRELTIKSTAPCFVHQEEGIMLKTIRDLFDTNVKEVLVQGSEAYKIALKFVNDITPHQVKQIKEYKGKTPIFSKFQIEDQLINLYQPVVHLPSGGYIVINPTEALISIDVNSGKATSERNIEEMALKTNLEAAKEIAKQAQLRDLYGLIVIDFIDLNEHRNRKILERSLWEFFSRDKAKIQTAPISNFGLLEMSRQRLRPSFLEIHSDMCSHCSGKGVVRAAEPNAMLILRTIENEIFSSKYDIINIYGISASILYLLNHKKREIEFIENKYKVKLNFLIDHEATSDSYSIEKIKNTATDKEEASTQPLLQDTSEIYNLEGSIIVPEIKSKKKIAKVNNAEPASAVVIDPLEETDAKTEATAPAKPKKISKNNKSRSRKKITKSKG